jgi:hypothetical protein
MLERVMIGSPSTPATTGRIAETFFSIQGEGVMFPVYDEDMRRRPGGR